MMKRAILIRARLEELLGKKIQASSFSWQGDVDGAESAAALLRNLIERGVIERDSELKALDLGKAFKVHRNTMAKALGQLVTEGYLENRAGRPARVVSDRPLRPIRRARIASQTELALNYGLGITTDIVERPQRFKAGKIHPDRRAKVLEALDIDEERLVIVYSRIRSLRGPRQNDWTPAIAETAYLVADLVPAPMFDDLSQQRVTSISNYLEHSGVRAVRSAYRLRSAKLPLLFRPRWAELMGIKVEKVADLHFLRLESITSGNLGVLEFSIADLNPLVYAIGTSEVTFELRSDAVRELSSTQSANKVARRHIGLV